MIELAIISWFNMSHFKKPWERKTTSKERSKFERKRKNQPPGPVGLPLLGNVVSFGMNDKKFCQYLRKNYGMVSQCYLLTTPFFMISKF